MNADAFARRWIGLFALMAGLLAIAPHFIGVAVHNSGCGDVSGGCERMTELFTLYGRRLILAAIVAPLLIAVAARALTVGAFVWAFPFAMLMLAGASPLFFQAAEFMSDFEPFDPMDEPAITPLIFVLLLLVGLSAYPDDREGGSVVAWRKVLGVVSVAAVLVTAPAWVTGLAEVPWLGQFALPTAFALARAHAALGIADHLPQLANYCLIAFVLAAAGLVVSRDKAPAGRRAIRA